MKVKFLKLSIIAALLILTGTGTAFAGGYRKHSNHPYAPAYKGYHHGGNHQGGYTQHRPYHHYNQWPRYHRYYHYGPPAPYYYNNYYYYRDYDPYYGGYYFSGAYSEPGFGFVFGSRGSW